MDNKALDNEGAAARENPGRDLPVVVLGGAWHLLFKLCLAAVAICLPLIAALMAFIVPSVIKNNTFREGGHVVVPSHLEALRSQIETRHNDAKWFAMEQVQDLNRRLEVKLENYFKDLKQEIQKERVGRNGVD